MGEKFLGERSSRRGLILEEAGLQHCTEASCDTKTASCLHQVVPQLKQVSSCPVLPPLLHYSDEGGGQAGGVGVRGGVHLLPTLNLQPK